MEFVVVKKLKNSCFRYTSMAGALEILGNNRITLVNPLSWDDKNDSYFIELYRNLLGDEAKISVLCFTTAVETFHHWKVFTPGDAGICIEFNRSKLVFSAAGLDSVETQDVKYYNFKELASLGIHNRNELPFIKRSGFGDEQEWRIVSRSHSSIDHIRYLPITSDFVKRIILSPFMPEPLMQNTKRMIRGMDGYSRVKIDSSRLTDSRLWKQQGDRLFSL